MVRSRRLAHRLFPRHFSDEVETDDDRITLALGEPYTPCAADPLAQHLRNPGHLSLRLL
jgi:hypothetical protein